MRDEIIKVAKANGVDVIGFAPAERFKKDDAIFKIMPETKTVIGLGFRILRGIYRGTEEGTTYYQYTTMAVENMEETVMPMAQVKLAMFIEQNGFTALPQRRHQTIMAESDSINPEVMNEDIYRNKTQETQIDFLNTAIKCGLGERGLHGALLNDDYGPLIRYCFVLTDAEIEPTAEYTPHLCDGCGKCAAACPGNAIDKNGNVDPWRCAVYYNGANGTKNPFMPPDAFADMDDRLEIIAGSAQIDPEKAKKIIKEIFFYPPAQHSYTCSICGRACDVDCYVHLEQKGVLKKKFKTPFRKRDKWRFSIDDFR